jgi:hypothetical protein
MIWKNNNQMVAIIKRKGFGVMRNMIFSLLVVAIGSSASVVPEVKQLKELYRETPLVNNGKAVCFIVASAAAQAEAETINQAIVQQTGIALPVLDPAQVKIPLTGNCIALGDRSNNALIDNLYIRHFCLTDKAYPGSGGYEVRTISNPTGKGFNVLLLGATRAEDLARATAFFVAQLAKLPAGKNLTAGYFMQIALPDGIKIPDYYRHGCTYGRQVGTGWLNKVGWGWNPLSYLLALYYQTGEEKYAREFIRLALPDEKAQRDLLTLDDSVFKELKSPLSTSYHYQFSFMVLYWDLVEESPVFSDEERLAVTRELARSMEAGYYDHGLECHSGSRHGQWANNSRYALARYFNRDYSDPYWHKVLKNSEDEYAQLLSKDSWILGEGCMPGWFVSGSLSPASHYLLLAGKLSYATPGALDTAMKFFEALDDGTPDSMFRETMSKFTFHQLAELSNDGKWLYYADQLPAIQPEPVKVGQSYLPDGRVKKREPIENMNRWLTVPMPKSVFEQYKVQAKPEDAFLALGYRSGLGAAGDLISLISFNAEYRTPFHNFTLFNLRIDGLPILRGFTNYLQTYLDGSSGRLIPTVGEVKRFEKVGRYAFATGRVPNAEIADWQRTIVLRHGEFAVVEDEVTSNVAGRSLNLVQNWQLATPCHARIDAPGTLLFNAAIPVEATAVTLNTKPEKRAFVDGSSIIAELEKAGDALEIVFPSDRDMKGTLSVDFSQYFNRPVSVLAELNGQLLAENLNLNRNDGYWQHTELIRKKPASLKKGTNTLRFLVQATAENQPAHIGISRIRFIPNAGEVNPIGICTAGAKAQAISAQHFIHAARRSPPQGGKSGLFSIVLPHVGENVTGFALDDRSAVFDADGIRRLVWSGKLDGWGNGELAIVGRDGLFGLKLTEFMGQVRFSVPVDIDWDFNSGVMDISAPAPVEMTFDGETRTVSGRTTVKFSAAVVAEKLDSLRDQTSDASESAVAAPLLQPESTGIKASVAPQFAQKIELPDGPAFAVAAGKEVLLQDFSGKKLLQLSLPSRVTAIGFFAPRQLLLVGGHDNTVTAFDLTGNVIWKFQSEDAKGVHAYHRHATKPGIAAIECGKLLEDQSQIFLGSASTLEIIDGSGNLFQRYLLNYGLVNILLPVADRRGNFLFAERSEYFVQGRRIDRNGKLLEGWNATLPGYKNFPSFGSLARTHLFVADFDDDGEPEILGDAQGMFQWLTAYTLDGTPKYQVNLGPGGAEKIGIGPSPAWPISDIAIGDLNGTPGVEVVLVNRFRRLTLFDGKLRPQWSTDLDFMPELVAVLPRQAGRPGFIVVAGGRSGEVFDSSGNRIAKLSLPAETVDLIVDSRLGKIVLILKNRDILIYDLTAFPIPKTGQVTSGQNDRSNKADRGV